MTLTMDGRTDQRIEVHVATTHAEREAVYRFRYEVYVEELGRYQAVADHEHRRLAEPEDAHSWIVYATAGDDVIGSLRVTWGGHGFSARQVDQYQLAPFLTELLPERMAVGERTTIAPRWRGADLFPALGEATTELSTAHDVRIVFGACEPHLISFYARYQRPYGTRNINSPEAGFLIPLVSFPQGPEALAEFGTAEDLPGCIRDVLHGSGTVTSPLFTGDEPYVRFVRESIETHQSSLFDGLTNHDLARCLDRSNVITCRQGDRLLKAGGSARNVFVVLRGALDVSRDGAHLGTIAAGEIVGEMAYLLRQPRACDVDVVENGTQVLSLSERTLAHLPDTAPSTASLLLSNVSRQLCRRLVPSH